MRRIGLVALSLLLVLVGRTAAQEVAPPVAKTVAIVHHEHGRDRPDDYAWLANRDDPAVVAHLAAENAYAEARLRPLRPLIDEIATELRGRKSAPDTSAAYRDNGFWYQRQFADGAAYPVIMRWRDEPDAVRETVLDVGALAAGRPVYRLDGWQPSPDGTRVAFAVDTAGDRRDHLFMRTIATGAIVDLGIADASGELAFASDGLTLFYVRRDPTTVRPFQVWRHRVGSPETPDTLVYEENDPTFTVSVSLTKSRRFVLIESEQESSTETRFLPADQPEVAPRVIEPRRKGLRYDVDHVGDTFFIRTDLDAPDFRVVTAPENDPGAAHWRALIAETPGRFIWRVEPFRDFVVIDEEDQGGMRLRVRRLADGTEYLVPQPAPIGVASTNFRFGGFGGNREPDAATLMFRFTGPTQPEQVYRLDMATRAVTLLRQAPAARWFERDRYAVERIEAAAPDGEHVPVTLLYRKNLRRTDGNPTLVYGYGAYGYSTRPIFDETVVSLVDRGFVYALAHVRGGREKGERWYKDGHGLAKRNSFTDLIAVGETLISRKIADRRALFAQGGSAGGLLVAATADLRPDLFTAIVAEVPFVDVVTTASSPTIPLSTLEYEEWGNPADPAAYASMLSWSPYDNVAARDYPAMFVTAGFNDTQVSYAEPAKWVARLRARRTDRHEMLFKTDMRAGHNGRSGRTGPVEETAEIYAWLLARAGVER